MDIIEHGREHYKEKYILRCSCGCLFSCGKEEVERKQRTEWIYVISAKCPECGYTVEEFPSYTDITDYQYSHGVAESIKCDIQHY